MRFGFSKVAVFGLASLLVVFSARAGMANPNAEMAVQEVIGAQMEAFKSDNGALAFSYASPTIKEIFRTPENFMSMVRQGYAPVYRPAEIDFRDFHVRGSQVVQRVFIRGADGEAVIATYTLEQARDGNWKITGVHMEKLPEVAA